MTDGRGATNVRPVRNTNNAYYSSTVPTVHSTDSVPAVKPAALDPAKLHSYQHSRRERACHCHPIPFVVGATLLAATSIAHPAAATAASAAASSCAA